MLTATPTRGALGPGRQIVAAIAVSAFGTWVYNVAIAVYAFERTHSAASVAAVTVGRYVPALVLSWWGSAMIDRLPRRAVAVVGDVGCAASMVGLGLLASNNAPMWSIVALAAASSTLARIQSAAVLSLGADIVIESQLVRTSVLAGAGEAVSAAAGAAAASLTLPHVSAAALFVVNGVTFALSGATLVTVPDVAPRPQRHADGRRRLPLAARATHYVPLHAIRFLVGYLTGVDVIALTVVATHRMHMGASGFGFLLAAAGVGGMIVAVLSRHQRRTLPLATVGPISVLLYAVPLVAFAAPLPIATGLLAQLLRGAGSVLATAVAVSGLQRAVPTAYAGRAFGAAHSIALLGTCLGALTTPALLDHAGAPAGLVIIASVCSAAAVALVVPLRHFDKTNAERLGELDPHIVTLRNLGLLRDASRAMLYTIADAIVEVKVEPGTPVVRQGESADAFFVLVAGEVEVTNASSAGTRVVGRLCAPNHFGEIGLLRGAPRNATVAAAVDPTRLWRIPADVFLTAVSTAGISGALSDTMRLRVPEGAALSESAPLPDPTA